MRKRERERERERDREREREHIEADAGADTTDMPRVIAGTAIPDAERQFGRAVEAGGSRRHSERAWAQTHSCHIFCCC